jgi:hypothetical protein
MVSASKEGPLISRKTSEKMMAGLLKFIGKLNLHTKWPNFWAKVVEDFDLVYTSFVSAQVSSMGLRSVFIQGHKHALSALVDMANIDIVEAAVAAKVDVPVAALQAMLQSSVGATLYKAEGVKLKYSLFVRSISKHIEDLEFHDYTLTELASFKTVMMNEARTVLAGTPGLGKKASKMEYLGQPMAVQVVSMHDEWSFRLHARLRSLAVSQCQVPRMKWENFLFSESETLEGFPTTVKLDSSLVGDMRNVRTAVAKLLEGYDDTLTFADMRKIVNSQEETLLGLERFFALDLQFLNEHAQPLAEQTVGANCSKPCQATTTSRHSRFRRASRTLTSASPRWSWVAVVSPW